MAGESAVCTKRVVGPAALSSFFLYFWVCLFVLLYLSYIPFTISAQGFASAFGVLMWVKHFN